MVPFFHLARSDNDLAGGTVRLGALPGQICPGDREATSDLDLRLSARRLLLWNISYTLGNIDLVADRVASQPRLKMIRYSFPALCRPSVPSDS